MNAPDTGLPFDAALEDAARLLGPKVVAWRRDIHQHPELGNREFRTSKLVAEHLRALGIEIRERVAHTGVVGVLKGALLFLADLVRAIPDIPVTVDFMSISRFAPDSGRVRILHDVETDLTGRDVVIV